MKCVIFCGGKGTRMGEAAENLPKPLIKIGEKPILEYIMKHYENHGVNEFVLCLGYLGDKIKDYFSDKDLKYKIDMVDTGENSSKIERLLKVKYLLEDMFFVSYGDDLSNVDLSKLLAFHKKEEKIATLTAVRLPNPYGVLELDEFDPYVVVNFKEKPIMNEWINGGYFVFNKKIFDYAKEGDELEKEVFERLARDRQLVAYRHNGFWKSMNTLKDAIELNEMFKNKELNDLFRLEKYNERILE